MRRFLQLLFFAPAACFAQPSYTLEGSLGKSLIYLYFDAYATPDDNHLGEVRYFYASQLKDIELDGTRNGDKFEFALKRTGGDEIVEKFVLTKRNNDFSGTWENQKGKKLPVKLHAVQKTEWRKKAPKAVADFPDEQLIDVIRATYMTFRRDSVTAYNGKKIEWFSETHCRSPFFRLADGFTDDTKKTVNPILEKMHYESALSQLTCSSPFSYNEGNEIEYTITINYLDENLLGFDEFSYWYCGGAHPDGGSTGFLIDLHSGKQFDIDDIVAFDKSVTTQKASDFKAFSGYREMYFAPTVFGLVNSEQHFVKPPEDDAEGCDYTDLQIWNFVSWNYTENGIAFTPHFTRYLRSCEDAFLVPFDKLRRYRHPNFPYAFGSQK